MAEKGRSELRRMIPVHMALQPRWVRGEQSCSGLVPRPRRGRFLSLTRKPNPSPSTPLPYTTYSSDRSISQSVSQSVTLSPLLLGFRGLPTYLVRSFAAESLWRPPASVAAAIRNQKEVGAYGYSAPLQLPTLDRMLAIIQDFSRRGRTNTQFASLDAGRKKKQASRIPQPFVYSSRLLGNYLGCRKSASQS